MLLSQVNVSWVVGKYVTISSTQKVIGEAFTVNKYYVQTQT